MEYIAIQIDSDDIGFSSSYFEPRETVFQRLNRGFGWQRGGKLQRVTGDIKQGPEGFCLCSKCGYAEKHQRSIPCSEIKCPRCGDYLKRE